MNKPMQKSTATAPLPVHELVYRDLRAMVLFGDLAPGQAVTIQGLAERMGAGMTPVREAIRRLIAEGALEFQGNRRVSVPKMTPDNVSEFIYARQWLDPHMAAMACEKATDVQLAELTEIDAQLDEAIFQGELRAYLELNYRFHTLIYDMAETPILAAMADGLWLRFGPSMRVVCGRLGTQNLPDRHKDFLSAMAARDAEAAAHAIRQDVTQGMEQVRATLS